MESLLGGVEEERREQGEENFGEGTLLKATSDNKHEEEPCEPQGANTPSSTSPNTDVTSSACPLKGPDGGTHNSEGAVTLEPPVQGPGAQDLESAEVRNPAPSPNPEPDVGDRPEIENGKEENETVGQQEGKCEDSVRISESENVTRGVSEKCPEKTPDSEEARIVGSPTETNVQPQPGPSSEKPGEAKSEVSKPAELSSELANLFSGELPSVSELQLLLPGVIQVSGCICKTSFGASKSTKTWV